jgi:hypothetical protein
MLKRLTQRREDAEELMKESLCVSASLRPKKARNA